MKSVWLFHKSNNEFRRNMTQLDATWPIKNELDMTHSHVTWLIHTWRDPFTCDMTHSHITWRIRMWHDEFACDMTNSNLTWLVHHKKKNRRCVGQEWCGHDAGTCDMTHSNMTWRVSMWHDPPAQDTEIEDAAAQNEVDKTNPRVWADTFERDMKHPNLT